MSVTTRPTCGSLYRAFEEECQTLGFMQPAAIPHGDVRLADRAIGHMRGQAEKVFLGACQAFMIRPGPDWFDWATLAMEYVCVHYGLEMTFAPLVGELWGCTSADVAEEVSRLMTYKRPNTILWHTRRAAWCGVKEVDREYHKRAEYGKPCEPLPTMATGRLEGRDADGHNRV